MNEFLQKMLELGAAEDQSCSDAERAIIYKESEKLYNKHITSLKNIESSSRIIERSQPKLNTKIERLMKAVTEMHPTLTMDDPKQEELYLSLHSLKDAVTSL
jgi:hypothetical protein